MVKRTKRLELQYLACTSTLTSVTRCTNFLQYMMHPAYTAALILLSPRPSRLKSRSCTRRWDRGAKSGFQAEHGTGDAAELFHLFVALYYSLHRHIHTYICMYMQIHKYMYFERYVSCHKSRSATCIMETEGPGRTMKGCADRQTQVGYTPYEFTWPFLSYSTYSIQQHDRAT